MTLPVRGTTYLEGAAPLTSCILGALPPEVVPVRFRHMITWVTRHYDTREAFHQDAVQFLTQFPKRKRMALESPTLTRLAERLALAKPETEFHTESRVFIEVVAQLYLLACMTTDEAALAMFKTALRLKGFPSPELSLLFRGAAKGVLEQPRYAVNVVDAVLVAVLRCELEDRFLLLRVIANFPYFVPRGTELVVMAGAHFNPEVCARFFDDVASKFITRDRFDAVAQAGRQDVGLFLSALRRLPPRVDWTLDSVSDKAKSKIRKSCFETEVWGDDQSPDVHPESARWAFAFCSVFPVDVFYAMQWHPSPREQAAMCRMRDTGWRLAPRDFCAALLSF